MPVPLIASDLDGLDEFATVRELEYLEAIRSTRSLRKAAEKMGLAKTTMANALSALKIRAASKGFSPAHDMTHKAAPGFQVKGTSTYYDKEGKPAGQWVKTTRDQAQTEEIVRAFVASMVEDVRGLHKATVGPKQCEEDLMTVYPLGDPHFGMYAWAQEAGDDFDLKKAEALTCQAIDRLVLTSPKSKKALLLNLGDFFHADDSSNATPGHGHALDVDTRYAMVMQVGVKSMVYCIKRLLDHHENVEVWMMPGNHDPHSSYALALCLSAYFDGEPRVKVDLSPGLYKYIEFGRVLLGSHHGHGAKGSDLPAIMACDQAESWGRTKHRYWYCGHIHHMSRDKEHPGCMVETFRTLAAKDAWHAGKGYRSGRDMYAITHHRLHGEIMRTRCDIGMLQD
jgi:hypothetical protein